MSSSLSVLKVQRSAVAVAVGLTCLAVQAQESPVEATVSVGLGGIDGSQADRALFGQYNGLRKDSTVGILGLEYTLRDLAAENWVDFTATNLLGDTRELRLSWKNPGHWKLNAFYSELTRTEPLIVNSGVGQVGTTTPQVQRVAAGQGNDLDLSTKRKGLGIGFTKILSPALQLEFDLKTEDKEGARLSGAYFNNLACASQQPAGSCNLATLGAFPALMLPEPIKSNHSQVEARVSYGFEKLRLNAGYYGSFFTNDNKALWPGPANALTRDAVLALPADNQAHQVDVGGSYDISPATRANFKLAWSTATQNADFSNMGMIGPLLAASLIPNQGVHVTSPGARVDTTLAKLGFSSRITPKLSLLGDLRYEDKDDKTNLFFYTTDSNGKPISTNHQLPNRKLQGKLQASWQFNPTYRGVLAADYESIDRGTYTATSLVQGISALRQDTRETGLRAELRRRLDDNLSGTVSLSSSKREGSNWLQPNPNAGATGVVALAQPETLVGAVFMPTLADRQRDKIKLSADWKATEKLDLQVSLENGTDSYSSPSVYGLNDSKMNQLNLDWTYALSGSWTLNGYLAQAKQTLNQSLYQGTVVALDNTNLSASIGMQGKLSGKLQVGASLVYMDDKSVYGQALHATASTAAAKQLAQSGGLPDITYKQTALKLFANYALEKKSSVRLDFLHQQTDVNDWTWNGLVYSDGTTVKPNGSQKVNFIGLTYVYKL